MRPESQWRSGVPALAVTGAGEGYSGGFGRVLAGLPQLRTGFAPLSGAREQLRGVPTTERTEAAKEKAVSAITRAIALSEGQADYREAMWDTGEFTGVKLDELSERLAERRHVVAAAQSAVDAFHASQELEKAAKGSSQRTEGLQ